jgi:DNA-binding MarR family transcriptional regulator
MNALDDYVIESLMADLVGHDHKPSAFLVYLMIAAIGPASLSYAELAERTGLSKRAVQMALAHLKARQLIEVRKGGVTEAARYVALTPWRRTE